MLEPQNEGVKPEQPHVHVELARVGHQHLLGAPRPRDPLLKARDRRLVYLDLRATDQLQVSNSVISDEDGVDYATEMSGMSTEEVELVPEAEGTCRPKGTDYSLYAVRIDEPTGEPGSLAPPVETEGTPPGTPPVSQGE